MNLTKLFRGFFESEKAGGFILVLLTIVSLIVANTSFGASYINFWNIELGGHSITHWINDGLMTIFFLLIGLELEREVYMGELSTLKNASLPAIGALGGVLVPAGIFLAINYGLPTQPGAGIPMATDIAFAIGILSLLGDKVPASLKIFLTALAVIDDLAAILVIAIFYTKTLVWLNLVIALIIFGVLLVFNRIKIRNLVPYLLGGVAMWYFMLHSGVHATITGVMLAFAIPFGNGDEQSTSHILQHNLHKPVAFLILPLFAMANTGIALGSNFLDGLSEPGSLGIIGGLVLGKPLGIFLFAFIGVTVGICSLPAELKWKHIIGAAILGGIGFTMSIFITLLAYTDSELINQAKIAILVASIIAALAGLITLKIMLNSTSAKQE